MLYSTNVKPLSVVLIAFTIAVMAVNAYIVSLITGENNGNGESEPVPSAFIFNLFIAVLTSLAVPVM